MPNCAEGLKSDRAARCAVCDGKSGLVRHYSWRTSLCSKCIDRPKARRESDCNWMGWLQIAFALLENRARYDAPDLITSQAMFGNNTDFTPHRPNRDRPGSSRRLPMTTSGELRKLCIGQGARSIGNQRCTGVAYMIDRWRSKLASFPITCRISSIGGNRFRSNHAHVTT